MSEKRRADILALAILAILPTLLFADVLLGINCLFTGDLPNYHYPGKKILRDIVLGGEFPFWNPYLSAGQPLAANPAHEVFYPLTWLILLPRYDLAFHLLIVVHVYIALFAMHALLRSFDLSRSAAVLGALSFGLGGVILSTFSVLPFLFSMSWTPLICLFARKYLLHRTPRDGVLAAIFLGVQLIIGEPTIAMQSGILLGLYAIYRGVHDGGNVGTVLRRVADVGLISIGALLVSAVQILPALDHFADSVRSRGLEFYVVSYWSMPLARFAELLYPALFGHTRLDGPYLYWGSGLYSVEMRPFFPSIYCGMLAAVLLAGGMVTRLRGAGLVAAIGATSWILAAGRHTPLLRGLYESGIADWLRYPEKFVFLFVFATVVFAAFTFDRVLKGDARARRAIMIVTAGATAVAFAAWIAGLTPAHESFFRRVWSPGPISPVAEMLAVSHTDWLLAALRGVLLFLLLRNLDRIRRAVWLALVGVFVVVDLFMLIPELSPRESPSYLRDTPAVARQLPPNRQSYRIFHQAAWNKRSPEAQLYTRPDPYLYWTTRNSLVPIMPPTYGLRLAMENDYDLTQLLPTKDFVDSVWDLAAVRPDDWGEIVSSMSNVWFVGVYRPHREALALANGDPRQIQPVRFVERTHSPRYYFASHVIAIRDRSGFVSALKAIPDPRGIACTYGTAFQPSRGVVRGWREWTNGAEIDVEAAGRAFLVMSVTPHKYWRVTIDDEGTQALVTNVGYQGVIVPAGRHVVRMEYRNPLIAVGGLISVTTLLSMGLFVRRATIRAR